MKSFDKKQKQSHNKIKHSTIFTGRFDLNLSHYQSYSNRIMVLQGIIQYTASNTGQTESCNKSQYVSLSIVQRQL